MVNTKRGKPQKWSDEDLKQIALEVKYKRPNRKVTSLLLEKKLELEGIHGVGE